MVSKMKNPFMLIALLVAALLTVSAASALLDEFTQTELSDNWIADRQYPSGGVESVSFAGRDNVAKIGVVAAEQSTAGQFYYTEGIKKVGEFGPHVRVDLYVPSEWQDADVVNVGFWSSDDPITSYPIMAYRNSDTVEAGFYTWTYDWDAASWGYVPSDVEVKYDDWNTLSISLSDTENVANYFINGEESGSVYNAGTSFGQVFLNHYNDGVRDYYAYWHVGMPDYRAAPAVAADLLKAADIKPRYGEKRDSGNHIADVADFMGEGTDFKGVMKEDVVAYECEVVKYLRSKDVPAMVLSSSECYDKIATVQVPSDETTVSVLGLSEDTTYLLEATGTYIYGTFNGNERVADAKCSLREPGVLNSETEPFWLSGDDLPDPYTNYLEVLVNGAVVDWGVPSGDCADDNAYSMEYSGASQLDFSMFDGGAIADNDGSIQVDVYAKLW